ncbi:hypothetical protein ACF0H5_017333 [Mactra antiquata]
MASASFLASCCLGNQSIIINNEIPQKHILLEETVVSTMSLIFSSASILGIGVLVLSWQPRFVGLSSSQNIIAQMCGANYASYWLSLSGMLANIGLIIRSTVWLLKYYPDPDDVNYYDGKHLFCISSSLWVQYFFLCVIFWHLAYAVETFVSSGGGECSRCIQHFLGWIVPGVLCAAGGCLAYMPKLKKCGSKYEVNSSMMYLTFLLPVIVCLILVVTLFYKSANRLKRTLIRHFGKYSTVERSIVDKVTSRCIIFVGTFCVCWLPNIVTGILVTTLEDPSLDVTVLVFLVLESVLNPFHVFIDSMVMFGWPPAGCCAIFRSHNHYDNSNYGNINDLECSQRSSEREPLLLSFSRNRR